MKQAASRGGESLEEERVSHGLSELKYNEIAINTRALLVAMEQYIEQQEVVKGCNGQEVTEFLEIMSAISSAEEAGA